MERYIRTIEKWTHIEYYNSIVLLGGKLQPYSKENSDVANFYSKIVPRTQDAEI